MIFTEDQFNNNYGVDAFDVLSEASYVDGLDIISPTTIPMAENSEVGGIVVRFSDVEALSEETGLDYIDTMLLIAEDHNLDPAYMAVAINESEVIVNPEIIEELANVVIVPQSENSLAYQFCEACLDSFIESGDEDYLWMMINEDDGETWKRGKKLRPNSNDADSFTTQGSNFLNALNNKAGEYLQRGMDIVGRNWKRLDNRRTSWAGVDSSGFEGGARTAEEQQKGANDYNMALKLQKGIDKFNAKKDWVKNNKGKAALGTAAAVGAGLLAKHVYDNYKGGKISSQASAVEDKMQAILQQAQNKPKSWIGKKIAALRGMYSQWLQRANRERDAGRAGMFKKIAATIMNCIDALMQKLQNFAG